MEKDEEEKLFLQITETDKKYIGGVEQKELLYCRTDKQDLHASHIETIFKTINEKAHADKKNIMTVFRVCDASGSWYSIKNLNDNKLHFERRPCKHVYEEEEYDDYGHAYSDLYDDDLYHDKATDLPNYRFPYLQITFLEAK